MNDIERLILKNQEALLLGVSALLTPKCKGGMDANGETCKNVLLIEQYKETKAALAKGG